MRHNVQCLTTLSPLSLSLSSFYIGIGRWLIVADPDIVKEMFVKRFDQFPQRAVSEWSINQQLVSLE